MRGTLATPSCAASHTLLQNHPQRLLLVAQLASAASARREGGWVFSKPVPC